MNFECELKMLYCSEIGLFGHIKTQLNRWGVNGQTDKQTDRGENI